MMKLPKGIIWFRPANTSIKVKVNKRKRKTSRSTKDDRQMGKILNIKPSEIVKIRSKLGKDVKSVPKGAFKLPIQTAVIVPSTYDVNKVISAAEFKRRIITARNGLSRLFGGYTRVKAEGGYYSSDKKQVIRERSAIVISYSERDNFMRRRAQFYAWVRKLKRIWKQESIGIIIENDMSYI